jgi:ATP-dependent Clp protease ATP-binding subunit ClpA
MATATKAGYSQDLDTKQRSSKSCHFENALRQKIVGQDEAIQALATVK